MSLNVWSWIFKLNKGNTNIIMEFLAGVCALYPNILYQSFNSNFEIGLNKLCLLNIITFNVCLTVSISKKLSM